MNPTVIIFLIVCIAWTALIYYIFFIRRASDLGAGGKSAFVIVVGIIIPILCMSLWSQAQSYNRLEELGFTVYEGLGNSVGMATGVGKSPTWLYSLKTSQERVLEFYRQPRNHKDWKLTSESTNSLEFMRGKLNMLIQANDNNVVFLLFDISEEKPNKLMDSEI